MATVSNQLHARQCKRLRALYRHRNHIAQLIHSLEQIERLRSRRRSQSLMELVAARVELPAYLHNYSRP